MHDPNSPQYKFYRALKQWIDDVQNDTENKCIIEAGPINREYTLGWIYLDDEDQTDVGVYVKRLRQGEMVNFTTHDQRYINAIARAIDDEELELSTTIVPHEGDEAEQILIKKFTVVDLRFKFRYFGVYPATYIAQNQARLEATQNNAGTGTGTGAGTSAGTEAEPGAAVRGAR